MASDITTEGSMADHSNNTGEEIFLELSYSSSSFDADEESASLASSSELAASSDIASGSDISSSEVSEIEGVHPFLYEPLASSSSEGEEGSDSDGVSPRLLNLNW